ncbi:MAG: restriction endonuclease [Deltaproteobacteria bacterium]|nr:restriction endonuclease [Deltaproteobacteria bacterium]
MGRTARWLGMEMVTWLIAGGVLVVVLALFAPAVVAVVVGGAATLALAIGSWSRRSRDGLARRRGLGAADRMSGEEFEDWLAILFRAAGWRVRHTRATGDFGADLVLGHGAVDEVVVQAKRQARPVGVAAVQQAAAARLHYGTDQAVVVTNSTFTPAALELAASTGVILWDREDISRELLSPGGRRSSGVAA